MPSGGYRPNSGPQKGTKYKPRKPKKEPKSTIPPDIQAEAAAENLDPITYLTRLMNDPTADPDRRDRAASLLLPYFHSRKGEGKGKKDEIEERAKRASDGKFAPSKPPIALVK